MLFGPRLSTVFASRWKALFWAACVMLTAYEVVSSTHLEAPASSAQSEPNPWAADSTGTSGQ